MWAPAVSIWQTFCLKPRCPWLLDASSSIATKWPSRALPRIEEVFDDDGDDDDDDGDDNGHDDGDDDGQKENEHENH